MTGEFKHTPLPQTFGTEFAGIIVEVGSNPKVNRITTFRIKNYQQNTATQLRRALKYKQPDY